MPVSQVQLDAWLALFGIKWIRHPLRGTSTISELTTCVERTHSSGFNSHLEHVLLGVRVSIHVLAKYGASDLCPGLINSIGSPLSSGQTCCHQVLKHLCYAAVANLVRSRNCHYASRGVGRIALRN
ncbi:hypothetical protein PIB30_042543 [Stylosanthes scabra]|uniref:Uncharacterized protein n=1 Tax=Stylosanthes scabra TaxID=79078 RepID=A0ABU6WIQ7_9FABA|nr:hypothetical protein [Stylosanthes scabra]